MYMVTASADNINIINAVTVIKATGLPGLGTAGAAGFLTTLEAIGAGAVS